jgi:hypothetical protein
LHAEPAGRQIDVAPLQRDDFPEPQARVTAQQHTSSWSSSPTARYPTVTRTE